MANYKTTDQILVIVFGLMSSITKPKYLIEKPTGKPGDTEVPEYVVINSLGINADTMQKCMINVNYHVKDIAPGVPDLTKIQSGSSSVLAILKKVSTTSYLIDFEGQEIIKEPALNEHFSNMRFSFKNINT